MSNLSRIVTVTVVLVVGVMLAGCDTSKGTSQTATTTAAVRNVTLDEVGISFDGPQWEAQNYPDGVKPTTGIVYVENGPFVNDHESRLTVVVTPGMLASAGSLGTTRVVQAGGEVTATSETSTTRRADYNVVDAPNTPADWFGATVWFQFDDTNLGWVEVLTGDAATTDAIMTGIEQTLTTP